MINSYQKYKYSEKESLPFFFIAYLDMPCTKKHGMTRFIIYIYITFNLNIPSINIF